MIWCSEGISRTETIYISMKLEYFFSHWIHLFCFLHVTKWNRFFSGSSVCPGGYLVCSLGLLTVLACCVCLHGCSRFQQTGTGSGHRIMHEELLSRRSKCCRMLQSCNVCRLFVCICVCVFVCRRWVGADTRGIKFRFEMADFLHLKGSRWVLF